MAPTNPCEDNPTYQIPKTNLSCTWLTGIKKCTKLKHVGYSKEQINDILSNCPKTCNSCTSCQDDVHYKNPLTDESCESNINIDCTAWRHYGLSIQQTLELIRSCPKSCNLCK